MKKNTEVSTSYFDYGVRDVNKATLSELKIDIQLLKKFLDLCKLCSKLKSKHECMKKDYSRAAKSKKYLKAAEIMRKQMESYIELIEKEQELGKLMLKYLLPRKEVAKLIKKDIKKIKKFNWRPIVY